MKLTFPVFDQSLVEDIETYLDQHYQTEIVDTIKLISHYADNKPVYSGVVLIRARGYTSDGRENLNTRNSNNYSRPMVQLISDADQMALSSQPQGGCRCYRFELSWSCPEHPDNMPWDAELGDFKRPVTNAADRLLDAYNRAAQQIDGLLVRLPETPAPERATVRERHDQENRVVLRYVTEQARRGDVC